MCGLAGFAGQGDRAVLERMTTALIHRGPDGAGYHIDAERGVYLGHRRLSILDIAGGDQPMWNEDRTVAVIFNGEIYNHRALRTELEQHGHVFRSDHSDTEVLVHGHEQWGPDLPLRLDGMFSYAVLDLRRNRLVLARDRFGEKPLFWAQCGGSFLFASELPGLQAHPLLADAGLDPMAVRKFLAYGFMPAPASGLQGVAKLPHGHQLVFDLTTRQATISPYWRFEIAVDDPPPGGPARWCEELLDLLDRAVASRLESDVPLGLFLSGGIDSSALLTSAARQIPAGEIQCFSIGFDEPSFDESTHAQTVAKHVGAAHDLETCALAEQARQIAPLLEQLGELVSDPSILPTWQLCRFARKHVTVAVSGDGGDELFAGYEPFQALRKARLYQALVPRPVHAAVAALVAKLPTSDRNMSLSFKVRRGLRGLGLPQRFWNPVWLAPLSAAEISALMREPVDEETLYAEAIVAWDHSAARSLVDRTIEFYTNFYFAEDILVKTDRAAMLNSLELRAPFLAMELVEFARRLPTSAKQRGGQGKWLLRQALRSRLPKSILERRKKGFGIPLSAWLRDLPAPPDSPALKVVDETQFRRMWQDHASRRQDHRSALWCWMSLRAAAFAERGADGVDRHFATA